MLVIHNWGNDEMFFQHVRSVMDLLTTPRLPLGARPKSVPPSASSGASTSASTSAATRAATPAVAADSDEEFGDAEEHELMVLQDDQHERDEDIPMSQSSSKSSLGSKSFKQKMMEQLNSLSSKMSKLLSKSQDENDESNSQVVSSKASVENIAEAPDLMIACRSVSHITTLFPFLEYKDNQFHCATCISYLSSTSTTPKYSTIHYDSADGIDFSKVDFTIRHMI
jgi:hypothetical protein